MTKRKIAGTDMVVIALILFAYLCRAAYVLELPFYYPMEIMRALIWIFIPIFWSISVSLRVI